MFTMFPQPPRLGNHTRLKRKRDRGCKEDKAEREREKEREYKLCLSSCCQGQRRSEAVLGLGSNVG